MLLALCVLSFVALVAGMYALGKHAFGAVVGVVAALLLASRLDFPFLAARGYIDIPYMALVLWAAALEVARPRRGGAVWVLLTLAGLMRPEAWVLTGAYAPWMVGALAVILAGAVYTLLNFSPSYVERELALRESVRADLSRVLSAPPVRAARACGPVAVPNHKLVPDMRWVADARADGVVARTERTPARGVVIVVTGGTRFLKHPAYGPFDQSEDSPRIQVPPEGFTRAVVGRRFTAYVRC